MRRMALSGSFGRVDATHEAAAMAACHDIRPLPSDRSLATRMSCGTIGHRQSERLRGPVSIFSLWRNSRTERAR